MHTTQTWQVPCLLTNTDGAIENVHLRLFCRLPPVCVSLLSESDRGSKPYEETQ